MSENVDNTLMLETLKATRPELATLNDRVAEFIGIVVEEHLQTRALMQTTRCHEMRLERRLDLVDEP